jgi:hypothetical protein
MMELFVVGVCSAKAGGLFGLEGLGQGRQSLGVEGSGCLLEGLGDLVERLLLGGGFFKGGMD